MKVYVSYRKCTMCNSKDPHSPNKLVMTFLQTSLCSAHLAEMRSNLQDLKSAEDPDEAILKFNQEHS